MKSLYAISATQKINCDKKRSWSFVYGLSFVSFYSHMKPPRNHHLHILMFTACFFCSWRLSVYLSCKSAKLPESVAFSGFVWFLIFEILFNSNFYLFNLVLFLELTVICYCSIFKFNIAHKKDKFMTKFDQNWCMFLWVIRQ